MTIVPAAVAGGRFRVTGDGGAFAAARWRAGRAFFWGARDEDPPAEESLWLRGVDRQTGAPVLIEPRGDFFQWVSDVEREAAARCAGSLGSPYLAAVLHAGPGVVYAEPPPGLPRGTSSTAEAAELALQACEAAASLHAAGVGNLCFDARNLRVTGPAERRRIVWIVPGAPALAALADATRPSDLVQARSAVGLGGDPVRGAAWGIVDFFASLLPASTLNRSPDGALLAVTDKRRVVDDLPGDVAALARLLLPFLPPSPSLLARVAAIPSVTALARLPLDWDAIIADGAAALAAVDPRHRDYLALPLAAAYHQRASRTWASGDPAAALADVERAVALDGASLPIATTRAVLLDTLGRGAEARRVIDAALGDLPAPHAGPYLDAAAASPAARARAHGTRGMIALRAGAVAEAEVDLCRALDGWPGAAAHGATPTHQSASAYFDRQRCPGCGWMGQGANFCNMCGAALGTAPMAGASTPVLAGGPCTPAAGEAALYAHALGAARYARGDFNGAAEAEALSIALEPSIARYRWALVGSLRKLGRDREARQQAEAIVASEPQVAAHRARFERLFKPEPRWVLEVMSVPSAHPAEAAALGGPVRFPGERIALHFSEWGRLSLGRSPGLCDLPFAHGSMGQSQPYGLELRDGKLFLVDHGAGNPATHNGDPLGFCAAVPLEPGDEITLGGAPFVLRVAVDAG